MSDAPKLTEAQMRLLPRIFPKSRGLRRVDDCLIFLGIVFVIRKGLRWREALDAYGPHKTFYDSWVRWSHMGVF